MPSCPNPKDRVKRFRNLPQRLFELPPEVRDPIIDELKIPAGVTKCCSACLIKIRRKIGPQSNLTDDEVNRMKKLLQEIGPKWSQLAETLNKTRVALKSFYFHYKKKYGFDIAVTEYYKLHPGEDRRQMTDGDESDMSASSSDERDGSSDTASAESPNNSLPINSTKEEINISTEILGPPPLTKPCGESDDRLIPPLGQPPRKQRIQEEYDSSATETADEENESSPANPKSPKVLHYPNSNSSISLLSAPLMVR